MSDPTAPDDGDAAPDPEQASNDQQSAPAGATPQEPSDSPAAEPSDDVLQEPSTEKEPEEEPVAPQPPAEEPNHLAVGIGVIGRPQTESETTT